MSRFLPVILISSVGFVMAACQNTETTTVRTTKKQYNSTGYLPPETSTETEVKPKPKVEESGATVETVKKVEVEVAPTPVPIPAVQDYPTAVPVEGKPGFVKSQNGSGIVDVRGYPPGTEVTDPYSGKVFLVP